MSFALRSTARPVVAARPAVRAARPASARSLRAVAVRAGIRAYPDPDFVAETLEAFPDKMIADVEEARALYSDGGYVYLDVRPALELDEVGKFKGCVNISPYTSKRVYDPEVNKKVVVREENPDFIAQVEKRFPDKETKLMVACSDGKSYSMDALGMLDDAGYVNLVALKGGYYAWFRTWDNNLRRRRGDGYTEASVAEGDSCGIHGTGAGFARVDAVEKWTPPTCY